MNIEDIMLRDIAEAEREQRKREERRAVQNTRHGEAIVKWACLAGGVLSVVVILFLVWCAISDTPHRRGFFGGTESRTERECAPAN